jgi:hypothetical protein
LFLQEIAQKSHLALNGSRASVEAIRESDKYTISSHNSQAAGTGGTGEGRDEKNMKPSIFKTNNYL